MIDKGDAGSIAVPCYTLCPCFRASGCCDMARVAVLAHGLRVPPPRVRPDVSRLHASIPVLTIGNGYSAYSVENHEILHERHLA